MKISIEGIPASGKTTILKILEDMGYDCYMDGEHKTRDQDTTDTINNRDSHWPAMKLIESSPYVLTKFLETLKFSEVSEEVRIYTRVKKDDLLSKITLRADWIPHFIILLDCQPDISVNRLSNRMPDQLNMSNSKVDSNVDSTVNSKVDSKVDSNDVQPKRTLSALQITEVYLQLDWILHPVNCDIPIFRVNASGTIYHTLHQVLEILKSIKSVKQ